MSGYPSVVLNKYNNMRCVRSEEFLEMREMKEEPKTLSSRKTHAAARSCLWRSPVARPATPEIRCITKSMSSSNSGRFAAVT